MHKTLNSKNSLDSMIINEASRSWSPHINWEVLIYLLGNVGWGKSISQKFQPSHQTGQLANWIRFQLFGVQYTVNLGPWQADAPPHLQNVQNDALLFLDLQVRFIKHTIFILLYLWAHLLIPWTDYIFLEHVCTVYC